MEKFDGEITTAYIGDNTTIRECVTVSRGTTDKYKTVIGENSIIGGNVWITSSVPANSVVTHTSEVKIKTQS